MMPVAHVYSPLEFLADGTDWDLVGIGMSSFLCLPAQDTDLSGILGCAVSKSSLLGSEFADLCTCFGSFKLDTTDGENKLPPEMSCAN